MEYHVPVMLKECLDGLNIKPDGIYVDATFGGGGHSRAILDRLGRGGHLYSFDQDLDAMGNVVDDERFTFVRSNFRFLKNFMRYYGVGHVDGILADLGVSSHHLDDETRGFSFRFEGRLDMRMNVAAGLSAADVVNGYDEEALAAVFYRYGELPQGRKIARTIVKAREKQRIEDIPQFLEVVKPFFLREREKKDMAKLFQALRIEVNCEMEALQQLLGAVPDLLSEDGRLVVMTYHSLEDRLVKNYIRCGNFDGVQERDFYGRLVAPLAAVNNKVIVASEEELAANPRSRSAKLRVAKRSGL